MFPMLWLLLFPVDGARPSFNTFAALPTAAGRGVEHFSLGASGWIWWWSLALCCWNGVWCWKGLCRGCCMYWAMYSGAWEPHTDAGGGFCLHILGGGWNISDDVEGWGVGTLATCAGWQRRTCMRGDVGLSTSTSSSSIYSVRRELIRLLAWNTVKLYIRLLLYGRRIFTVSKPHIRGPRIFNIIYHQQKLSSLLITLNIKLYGSLYSVFYAKASKRSLTSLNEQGMCQTPSFIISPVRLPVAPGHISWHSFRSIASIQYNTIN